VPASAAKPAAAPTLVHTPVPAPSRLQSFLRYPQLSLKPEVEWPEGFRESGNGERKPGAILRNPDC